MGPFGKPDHSRYSQVISDTAPDLTRTTNKDNIEPSLNTADWSRKKAKPFCYSLSWLTRQLFTCGYLREKIVRKLLRCIKAEFLNLLTIENLI